ncbi:MAG: YHS domain-containing (seleno)protein [Alphaproteobacteria bacterium]
MLRGTILSILALAGLCVAIAAPLGAADRQGADAPLAVGGFDTTVYFDRGAAIRGRATNTVEYEGETYWFSTESNKKAFVAAPFRYLPQYDGYDAYGVFLGEVVAANPRLWSVENGRLYLFSTADRRDAWLRSQDSHRRKADRNWPGIEIGLARAKEHRDEEAGRAAAAANQNCAQVFRDHYSVPNRHDLIVNACKASADAGNANDAVYLARVFAEAYSPHHNYAKAARLLKFAADEGNEEARWRLGDLYADGHGVPKNLELAYKMYKSAAEHGIPDAMLRVARSYQDGRGTEQDIVKAWAWFNIASNHSDRAAHERDRLEPKMTAEELDRAQITTIALLGRLQFTRDRS